VSSLDIAINHRAAWAEGNPIFAEFPKLQDGALMDRLSSQSSRLAPPREGKAMGMALQSRFSRGELG